MALRGRRLWFSILGGVVGLLILAVVLLPLLVPREHLRQLAEQRAREATGGEVSLGPLSLRVLPRLRLVLGESTAQVTGEGLRAAGQDPGPLLSADLALERLEVDLALWPLLRRELDFGEVRLVAPRLQVVTAPAVAPDPDVPAAEIPAEPAPPATDFGLALAAVVVRDGEVHWREEGTGREILLAGWQQDMSAPQLGLFLQRLQRLNGLELPPDAVPGPVALELAARAATLTLRGFGEQPLPPLADLRLNGELSLGPAADRAEFRVTELTMTGWQATASGHVTAERIEATELSIAGGQALALSGSLGLARSPAGGPLTGDLSGTVDLALILAQLAPLLPPRPPDAAPLPELTGTLQVALAADLPTTPPLEREGLAGKLALTGRGGPVTIATPQLGEPLRIASLALTSDLRSARGTTRLEAGGIVHPILQGDVVAEIVPAVGEAQALQARLELPRLDLDALTEQVEQARSASAQQTRAGFSLVGTALAQPPAGGAAPGELIPADLNVDLTATVREIVYLKSTYTQARFAGTLRERVIDVSEFTAKLGAGQVGGSAKVDYAADPRGKASWDMRIQDAPAGVLLAPYVPLLAELWTGSLTVEAKGSAGLADAQALLRSLSLDGNLRGRDGVIDLREQFAGISQYLGQRQDLLRVQYRDAFQIFKVEDGRVKLTGLRIDGRDTDWRGDGWIGLDGMLDLDLNVKLPAGFTPSLGDLSFLADALRDQDGRIGLDFTLSGDVRRPAVRLNLEPAAMLQSDKLKGDALKKLQEEAKKGADSLLDRLRRGGGG